MIARLRAWWRKRRRPDGPPYRQVFGPVKISGLDHDPAAEDWIHVYAAQLAKRVEADIYGTGPSRGHRPDLVIIDDIADAPTQAQFDAWLADIGASGVWAPAPTTDTASLSIETLEQAIADIEAAEHLPCGHRDKPHVLAPGARPAMCLHCGYQPPGSG